MKAINIIAFCIIVSTSYLSCSDQKKQFQKVAQRRESILLEAIRWNKQINNPIKGTPENNTQKQDEEIIEKTTQINQKLKDRSTTHIGFMNYIAETQNYLAEIDKKNQELEIRRQMELRQINTKSQSQERIEISIESIKLEQLKHALSTLQIFLSNGPKSSDESGLHDFYAARCEDMKAEISLIEDREQEKSKK